MKYTTSQECIRNTELSKLEHTF